MSQQNKLALAIAAACCVAGNVQAFDPAATVVDYRMVIGGATAPTTTIRDVVIRDVCDVTQGPITQFLWQATPHYTIACTTAANKKVLVMKNDGGSGAGTTPVDELIAIEVLQSPTFAACTTATAQTAFATTAYTRRTCGSTNTALLGLRAPDFGISDIEPSKFVGALAPAEGDFRNLSGMQINSVAGLGFGFLVNANLYKALQVAQFADTAACSPVPTTDTTTRTSSATAPVINPGANGIKDAYEAFGTNSTGGSATFTRKHALGDTEACMPTLSRSQAETLLMSNDTGVLDWTELKAKGSDLVALSSTFNWAAGDATKILCRRTSGSGTHAQNSIYFLRTQCGGGASSGGQVMPTGTQHSTSLSATPPGCGSTVCDLVLENVSSGNLLACVADTQSEGFWGVGYASVESNATLDADVRFVKIDGVAPTLVNMVNGTYPNFGELTMQSRSGGVATAYQVSNVPVAERAEAKLRWDRIVQELTTVGNVQALNADNRFRHPFGNAGFLARAVPTSFTYNPASPIATQVHADPAVVDAALVPVQNTCFGPVTTQGISVE